VPEAKQEKTNTRNVGFILILQEKENLNAHGERRGHAAASTAGNLEKKALFDVRFVRGAPQLHGWSQNTLDLLGTTRFPLDLLNVFRSKGFSTMYVPGPKPVSLGRTFQGRSSFDFMPLSPFGLSGGSMYRSGVGDSPAFTRTP
jgi:hypothetical protein